MDNKNVSKIVDFMQNHIEQTGYSKKDVFFQLEPLGSQNSKDTENALQYTGLSQEEFYNALNVCIARGYVSSSKCIGIKYAWLQLVVIPGEDGVYANPMIYNGNFYIKGNCQFGDGNTQNNR